MDDEVRVLRDDTSERGLRRLRVMGARDFDYDEFIEMAAAQGEVALWDYWIDEDLGNHYFYLAWRIGMANYPMWAVSFKEMEFKKAIMLATARYNERFGDWPDQGILRLEDAEAIKGLKGCENFKPEKGEDGWECTIRLSDGELKNVYCSLMFRLVERSWQRGVVGVWREKLLIVDC